MMMTDDSGLPSPRIVALAAIMFFLPVAVSFAVAPDARWADYLGILFHLSLFFLVPLLPAPSWARTAGYGWLIIDVTVGVLSINGVPDAIAQPIRLGGHIFAGIWIVFTSLSGSTPVKIMGSIAGLWLFSFTFVSPLFPMKALGPASISVLIWLGFIAWQNGTAPEARRRLGMSSLSRSGVMPGQ